MLRSCVPLYRACVCHFSHTPVSASQSCVQMRHLRSRVCHSPRGSVSHLLSCACMLRIGVLHVLECVTRVCTRVLHTHGCASATCRAGVCVHAAPKGAWVPCQRARECHTAVRVRVTLLCTCMHATLICVCVLRGCVHECIPRRRVWCACHADVCMCVLHAYAIRMVDVCVRVALT